MDLNYMNDEYSALYRPNEAPCDSELDSMYSFTLEKLLALADKELRRDPSMDWGTLSYLTQTPELVELLKKVAFEIAALRAG